METFLDKNIIKISKICRNISKKIFMDLNEGINISEISNKYNNILYENSNFKTLSPITFEFEKIIKGYSPIVDFKLKKDSIISYTINIKYKMYNIKLANLRSVSIENDFGYIVNECLSCAMINAINTAKYNVPISNITSIIEKTLLKYNLYTIRDVFGYGLTDPLELIPNITPINKSVIKLSSNNLKNGHYYYIDIYVTNYTSHIVSKTYDTSTLFYFKINDSNKKIENMKINNIVNTQSKNIIKWIRDLYYNKIFSLTQIYKKWNSNKSITQSIKFLYENNFISPIRCNYIDIDNIKIAHKGSTIFVTKEKTYKLT